MKLIFIMAILLGVALLNSILIVLATRLVLLSISWLKTRYLNSLIRSKTVIDKMLVTYIIKDRRSFGLIDQLLAVVTLVLLACAPVYATSMTQRIAMGHGYTVVHFNETRQQLQLAPSKCARKEDDNSDSDILDGISLDSPANIDYHFNRIVSQVNITKEGPSSDIFIRAAFFDSVRSLCWLMEDTLLLYSLERKEYSLVKKGYSGAIGVEDINELLADAEYLWDNKFKSEMHNDLGSWLNLAKSKLIQQEYKTLPHGYQIIDS
jgi:hypothetical protein